jgi:magnesium transporter
LGLIRKRGIDYLFNRLVDASVDNYFLVIHELGELIEDLEDIVVADPSQETLENIQDLKKEAIKVRRIVIPVREVVGILLKVETIVISPQTLVFVRSIYDHLIQIVDSIELHREMLSSFLDIYLSSLSNKTNDVMKVLTIVTSVFIPLSFLAGVYGMNFQNMPELNWKYGYLLIWIVMISIGGGLLYYFKRKNWL